MTLWPDLTDGSILFLPFTIPNDARIIPATFRVPEPIAGTFRTPSQLAATFRVPAPIQATFED